MTDGGGAKRRDVGIAPYGAAAYRGAPGRHNAGAGRSGVHFKKRIVDFFIDRRMEGV